MSGDFQTVQTTPPGSCRDRSIPFRREGSAPSRRPRQDGKRGQSADVVGKIGCGIAVLKEDHGGQRYWTRHVEKTTHLVANVLEELPSSSPARFTRPSSGGFRTHRALKRLYGRMHCWETESGWMRTGTLPWYRRLLRSREEFVGSWGEWLALHHIRLLGWDVVARNWCCGRGEVDLIAYDGPYLVFVEVKTRTSAQRSPPAEENFSPQKARQLERLAFRFCGRYHLMEVPTRFDLIAIQTPDLKSFELRHYFLPEDAFGKPSIPAWAVVWKPTVNRTTVNG